MMEYQARQRRRRRWHWVVGAMACAVVFCTTYALILPALTMEAPQVLDCRYEGHTHTDGCYDGDGNLICGQADFVVHTHTEECYDGDGTLACSLPEIEAHTHTEECYTEELVLTCENEEDGHAHTDACYETVGTLTCGKEEIILHTHTEECYDGDGNLICGRPEVLEHVHTAACFHTVGQAPASYTYEDESVAVKVTLAEGSAVPEDAVLSVRPITGASGDAADDAADGGYEDLVRQAQEAVGQPVMDIVLYDISFCTADGESLPVEDSATVTLRFKENVLPDGADQVAVLHYQEDAALPVALDDVNVVRDQDDTVVALSFETEGFSVYGVMALADTDGGFTLTYGGYTITLKLVDQNGSPISGDYSRNIAAEDATLYKFADLAPELQGYAYSGAAWGTAAVVSVGTTGYTDEVVGSKITNTFRLYATDPIESGQWYSKTQDLTVTLTYRLTDPDGKSFAIVNRLDGVNYAMTAAGAEVNTVEGLASQTVSMNSSNQVTGSGAVLWTFEKVEGTDDQYYVYTTDGGTRNYLTLCAVPYDGSDGSGSLTLSGTPQAINVRLLDSGAVVLYSADSGSTVNRDSETGIYWCFNDWEDPSAYSQLLLAEVLEVKTVPSVSPSGTVINLFDYWTSDRVEDDVAYNRDTGINDGHALKFTSGGFGTQGESANKYTGSSSIFEDIVNNTLSNGYPTLTESAVFADSSGTLLSGGGESLAYLFDPSVENAYRAAYRNVSGLLQVDENGYYYYNSKENYAEFDEEANAFTLYNTWGVNYKNEQGMFFPFNSYESVGQTTTADNAGLNHYFGMSLTTRFVQQNDGYTNGYTDALNRIPTQFSFAGDDDVWIFVDDVLVADLGGIHDAAEVTIDFSTGEVIINGTAATTLYEAFAAAGRADSVEWSEDEDGNGSSDTFANNTYHTLKFYYLERGSYASNLKLQYNLTEYPPTSIYKVNQYGTAVSGAVFAVYQTDEAYNYVTDSGEYVDLSEQEYQVDESTGRITLEDGRTISCRYLGTTDKSGSMTFVDGDKMPYTLAELQQMFGSYFVLKEVKIPEGYRLVSDDVQLYIYNNKLLQCENTYESGVFADTNLQVTAPIRLKPVAGADKLVEAVTAHPAYEAETNTIAYYDVDTGDTAGSLFAVVLKYTGPRDADGSAAPEDLVKQESWKPLYGTDESGFILVDVEQKFGGDFAKAAAYAVSKYVESKPLFALSSSGNVTATINGMPGDALTYYTILDEDDKEKTQYTVAYYWTTLDLDGSAESWSQVSSANTIRVDADAAGCQFDRTFGAVINVPNLLNRLMVQKLDEDGNLVNGASFALYTVQEQDGRIYYVADDGTLIYLAADANGRGTGAASLAGGGDGVYSVDSATGGIAVTAGGKTYTITPVQTAETQAAEKNSVGEDGTADFTNMDEGYYYLREIAAPQGYELNSAEIMVLVDETAVYANAGTAGDGVTVGRGPGYVVSTLDTFASPGEIDNTLTWVYERLLVSGESASYADVYTALDENGSPALDGSGGASWGYLTENYSTSLTKAADEALTTYLVYENDGENTLFNYTINADRYPAGTEGVTRRLYTDVGWSYYLLYQDSVYGAAEAAANGANYTRLLNEDGSAQEISNLFSRSTFVRVTDEKSVGDLEISKVVVPETATAFQFQLSLFEPGDGAAPLGGTYCYQLYDVTYGTDGREDLTARAPVVLTGEDGQPVLDENGDPAYVTGTIENGTAALSLRNNQVVVIKDLPYGAHYTITESVGSGDTTNGYEPQVVTNGGTAVKDAETAGTLEWREERDGNVCTVQYINALLPLIKVMKVDGGNGEPLAGASFVLYRRETAADADGGALETRYYYHHGGFYALAEGEDETRYACLTPDSGELLFANLTPGETYYLKEVSAPADYNRLTSEIVFQVTADESGKTTITAASEDETQFTVAGTAYDGQELDITVRNLPAFELPELGGPGTFHYTIGGTLFLAGGLLCGCLLRRKEERRSAR